MLGKGTGIVRSHLEKAMAAAGPAAVAAVGTLGVVPAAAAGGEGQQPQQQQLEAAAVLLEGPAGVDAVQGVVTSHEAAAVKMLEDVQVVVEANQARRKPKVRTVRVVGQCCCVLGREGSCVVTVTQHVCEKVGNAGVRVSRRCVHKEAQTLVCLAPFMLRPPLVHLCSLHGSTGCQGCTCLSVGMQAARRLVCTTPHLAIQRCCRCLLVVLHACARVASTHRLPKVLVTSCLIRWQSARLLSTSSPRCSSATAPSRSTPPCLSCVRR